MEGCGCKTRLELDSEGRASQLCCADHGIRAMQPGCYGVVESALGKHRWLDLQECMLVPRGCCVHRATSGQAVRDWLCPPHC